MYKKIAFICVIAAGCGSSETAEHSEHSGGEHHSGGHEHHGQEHGEHHGGEHHDDQHEHANGEGHEHGAEHSGHRGPPEVLVPYHDVLAPIWHSEAGQVRADLACAGVTDLIAQGEALAAAPAPSEHPDWASEVGLIGTDAQGLAMTCGNEASTVEEKEASLNVLHDRFHSLMEMARQ
ncbi:MAG: hypothetical protein AB8H86_26665 [Polyangiales bacterium]